MGGLPAFFLNFSTRVFLYFAPLVFIIGERFLVAVFELAGSPTPAPMVEVVRFEGAIGVVDSLDATAVVIIEDFTKFHTVG